MIENREVASLGLLHYYDSGNLNNDIIEILSAIKESIIWTGKIFICELFGKLPKTTKFYPAKHSQINLIMLNALKIFYYKFLSLF